MESYTKRLSSLIQTENPIIIGLSFGGMIAVELSKLLKGHFLLISTAKTYIEIPFRYRLAGKLKLHKFLPSSFLRKPQWITYYLFGVVTRDARKLLREILRDTDLQFSQWAINQILNWKNLNLPESYIHVHGTEDRLLPNGNAQIYIEEAGHLMILTHSSQINKIIDDFLLSVNSSSKQ